jgi:hypothetical protein
MSHIDDWIISHPIEAHRLTALTKARTPTRDGPSSAWSQLQTYARTKLELGEVVDMLEGLLQAAQEHPELRQAYEAEQLACLEGKTHPTTDEDDPIIPPVHKKESGMDTRPSPATQEMLTRITKRQQEQPTLTYEQASAQVLREDPEIYRDYLDEQRHPQPRSRQVEKRDLPAYETVLKMVAHQRTQHPEMSSADAWFQVLKKHEGREEFNTVWECYRKYQVSAEGLRDHDAAVLAKGRVR